MSIVVVVVMNHMLVWRLLDNIFADFEFVIPYIIHVYFRMVNIGDIVIGHIKLCNGLFAIKRQLFIGSM